MNSELLTIMWGNPSAIIYFPLIFIVGALLAYRMLRIRRTVAKLSSKEHSSLLIQNFSLRKENVKIAFFLVGTLFLFLTLLRPSWGKKDEKIVHEGRDLFIALDISRSMLAADCKPNRLACAKQKISSLLDALNFDRVGLILFSGSTFIQCPLTSDYGAFHMFLDHIDVETISSGTTALDQAISQAIYAFKDMPKRKNKLLVLCTDGEDFSTNLSAVKEQAIKEGIHIFALGIGSSQGAPIPLIDEYGNQKGHQRDKKGSVVISHLNEGILSNLAHDSGGEYIRYDAQGGDIKNLIARILSYEKEKIEDKHIERYQEQYPYFLAISFICFALEWIL